MNENEATLQTITVRQYLDDQGHETVYVACEPEEASLVTLLGMLELAKDSIIRQRMEDDL